MSGVTYLRAGRRFGPQPRPCVTCEADTLEPGEMCAPCRLKQSGEVAASFLQSTAADAVQRLERLKPSDMPQHLRLPLAQALSDVRRVYDACEPLIHSFQIGVVRVEENEYWAFPMFSHERLGPFGKRGHAERALVDHAIENGDWDTESEP